jgi:probable rRNA maturation factor
MITIEPPRAKAGAGMGKAEVARFLKRARAAVGLEGEVHVLLADDATLRRLNKTFRGKDKATDVLSFPAGAATVFFGEQELAGDLAISLETAARQAKQYGHTPAIEVRVLLLHGLLHLAGFDHERDKGEMAARERELRVELGLPGGLIERSADVSKGKTAGRTVRAAVVARSTSGSLRQAQGRLFDSGSRKGARTSVQDDKQKRNGRVRA